MKRTRRQRRKDAKCYGYPSMAAIDKMRRPGRAAAVKMQRKILAMGGKINGEYKVSVL